LRNFRSGRLRKKSKKFAKLLGEDTIEYYGVGRRDKNQEAGEGVEGEEEREGVEGEEEDEEDTAQEILVEKGEMGGREDQTLGEGSGGNGFQPTPLSTHVPLVSHRGDSFTLSQKVSVGSEDLLWGGGGRGEEEEDNGWRGGGEADEQDFKDGEGLIALLDCGYPATQCNTLQHAAAHCSTLQHTASHCITLHHTAAHY